jgi:hypothetical protein
MRGVTNGANMAAMKFLVVGQFVDDMQYGFRSIVNQIPQVTMAFGGSMGLAGALSIVGVGINQLINHWDDLSVAFGAADTKTEAQKMDELGKATSRTAIEQDKLNRYRREQKTIEDQAQRRPRAEGEIGREVGAEIGELNAGDLKGRLTRALLAGMDSTVTDAEVQKRLSEQIAASGGALSGQGIAAARPAIRREMEEERAKKNQDLAIAAAATLLANAEDGPGQIGQNARRRVGELLPGPEGDIFRDPMKRQKEKKQADAFWDDFLKTLGEDERAAELDARKVSDRFWKGFLKDLDDDEKAAKEARERGLLDVQIAANVADFLEKDAKDRARLDARGSDLDWRLMQLQNPEARGQSMGIAAYEASFKAQTGLSEEAKRLHAINEVLEDIRDNNRNIKLIGVRRP